MRTSSWHIGCISIIFLCFFLQFWMEVLRESYDTQKYSQQRGFSLENCSHKMKALLLFWSMIAMHWLSKVVFGFLNLHALLQSENIEEDMNKFKNIYADDVNFSELSYEIARFNRLAQSSGTAFQSDATALDKLQWLTNYRICQCFSNHGSPRLCGWVAKASKLPHVKEKMCAHKI